LKLCENCSQITDGICSKFKKAPIKGFANKCRHFDGEEVAMQVDLNCVPFVYDDNWCLEIKTGEEFPYIWHPRTPWSCGRCEWKR